MSRLRPRLAALGRFGLLVGLGALAIALVFLAWTSRTEAERLSALLDRGQTERFFRPIPQIHDRNRGPATTEDLTKLLDQFRDEGLRYLAEFDTHGALIAEAGQANGPVQPSRRAGPSEPLIVGERVRVTFRPPPGRALPDLVIEFEPTVSSQLRDRADKTFVFSIAAALSLLVLTTLLWLALVREARQRERNERERQLAVLGEMSAVLAHEIRNPLASLKGTAQLLGEQLDAASPLQKKVTRIVDESKRIEELSGTLLDLVRSSTIARKDVDPSQLVRDAVQSVNPERIVVDTSAAPATWSLDALRFEQVLKNLLQNAVQADSSGTIETAVTTTRGKLVIRIRDHGPGLPEGCEQKIFEAFHTTKTKGTGLGLAVARRIIELHGGHLQGETHPDGGALFTLLIPA